MSQECMMNKLIYTLIFTATPALAFLGGGDTNISHDVPCIGLDGVPINGSLEASCCRNGQLISNPPATCRAGFHTISSDAVGGVATNITLAQNTLGVAHDLNGVQTNLNQIDAPNSGTQSNSTAPNAVTSALHGGTDNLMNGDGGFGSASALGAGGRAGSGSGSGSGMGSGSGEGGGIGGSGLGSAGGTGSGKDGLKDGSALDPNADVNKPSNGKYASNGGAGGNGNAPFGSMDMNFSGAGAGGNGEGSGNGMDELGFGDEDLAADGANGDVEGTIVDPSNYFALTNKSDDIFKIVSRRYTKKFHKLAGKTKLRVPAGKLPNNKPL